MSRLWNGRLAARSRPPGTASVRPWARRGHSRGWEIKRLRVTLFAYAIVARRGWLALFIPERESAAGGNALLPQL